MENTIELLEETQAAKILTVEVGTLRNWRVSGKGPRYTTIGRLIRYRPEDLKVFVEAGLRLSTSDKRAPGKNSPRALAHT